MIDQLATASKPTTAERLPARSAVAVPDAAALLPLPAAANENGLPADDPALRLAAEALAREQARREQRRRRTQQRRRWLVLLLAMLVTLTALKLLARDVVRLLPGATHLYRQLGVSVAFDAWRVESLRMRWLPAMDGNAELSITGRIRNRSRQALPMPVVVLHLLNVDGKPIYSWRIAPRANTRIQAGKTARIHTRIAHVPRNAFSLRIHIRAAANGALANRP